MKWKRLFIFFLFSGCITIGPDALAQDTLPNFTVRNIGNGRIVVGWVNNYPITRQISIQRSFDSLKNYKTILTVADPAAVQNGFADTKAPNDHMFYRLFVNLDKGEFFFTEAKQPVLGVDNSNPEVLMQKANDSVATAPVKKPVVRKPDFVPSFYVYTNKDGYVFINLPDADKKRYHIKFYEDDDSFLFELKNITETALTLDKANFIHAGWFKFELFNHEELVEKNKFYLSKDF